MDYYLGTDSVSLQEMLDIDIKCEVEGVIGGNPDLEFNISDLSPLNYEDVDHNNEFNSWFGSANLFNGNSNSSNSYVDLHGSDAASIMVNPNSVMPLTATQCYISEQKKLNILKKSKPQDVYEINSRIDNENFNETDLEDSYENDDESEEVETEDEVLQESHPNVQLKCKSRTQFFFSSNNGKLNKAIQQNYNRPEMNSVKNIRLIEKDIKVTSNQVTTQVTNSQNISLPPTVDNGLNLLRTQNIKRETQELSDPLGHDFNDRHYPKPAYSYSCLIAMALKNSQTGSLPVSEIYNFMCEHFPYFKTAPNGWKNSVRHNLSLNKCFEKIEKPAGNGNQRKGCLWAINPSKISKMDEEVQKWSRKDPLAIKKAMIYPDLLELLEKGEMKYIASGHVSEESESSSDEGIEDGSVVYAETSHKHITANSVTDSFDESSQDCDIDVTDQLYEDIDIEDSKESVHVQLKLNSESSDYQTPSISTKRQKTSLKNFQSNYLYSNVHSSRKKSPILLTSSTKTGSFIKIE